MKIGIYTDVHCSYTSSILPIHQEGSKYTTRLQMIIDTFRWMYEVFEENKVDVIVNCGDLFDSFNVRAEELSAMAEALSYGGKICELHILGNHEVKDKLRRFSAVALLDNYSHIDVLSDPVKLDNKISLLPYCTIDEATDIIPYLSNDLLFSHIDIRGSYVTPQYALESGVEPTRLANNFKCVFNGHLHSPQSFGGSVHNIGATTSTSFSDNSDYTPRIGIYDTNTHQIQYFNNPHAIRFIKLDNATPAEVENLAISSQNPMALRIKCNSSDRANIEKIVNSYLSVKAYRIMADTATVNTAQEEEQPIQLENISDIDGKFVEFIEASSELKYPVAEYLSVVKAISGGAESET